MTVCLPDLPVYDGLAHGLARGARADVQRVPGHEVTRRLIAGTCDLALVPTLDVLRMADDLTVLPSVAVSSWSYPYARLLLRGDLGAPIRSVAFEPAAQQEVVLTRLVLREHYGATPTFTPVPEATADLLAAHDAVLVTGASAPDVAAPGLALDLGQEVFELTQYPMVWGLFATRAGEATPEMLRALKRAAREAEAAQGTQARAHADDPSVEEFYGDDLRVRYDDLATASLTEITDLLYQQAVLDDAPEIPLARFPDEDIDEDDEDLDPMV